jgi:hypothetical protein
MPPAIWTDSVTVEWAPASDPFDDTPTWVNITAYVTGVSINRGRSGVFDLYGAGKATITLDNSAGTFDQTQWYRWRQVRVTALATGPTTVEVFYGFVETILHSQPTNTKSATATIQAVDLMGIVSRYEYNAASVSTEYSGVRIQRLVTAIGFPAAWQSIVTGYIIVAAMDDGAVNALQHMQDVAEAEIGAIFVSRQGVLAYEDRYELLDRLDSAAEATFSDTYAGTEVPYLQGDLTLTLPGRDYRNRVTFTATDGDPQTSADVPTNFPADSLSRTVPVESDSEAMANSVALLEVYSQQTVVWPEYLSISVNSQNIIDRVCPLDLRRYCLVEFTPAGRAQQSYKVFVESIQHTMTAVGWVCRIGFSSADRWEDAWGTKAAYLELDDATLGLLGTGKLGY